jgi:hypothetical protein
VTNPWTRENGGAGSKKSWSWWAWLLIGGVLFIIAYMAWAKWGKKPAKQTTSPSPSPTTGVAPQATELPDGIMRSTGSAADEEEADSDDDDDDDSTLADGVLTPGIAAGLT